MSYKTEGKRKHGRPQSRWRVNIPVDRKERMNEDVNMIHLAKG